MIYQLNYQIIQQDQVITMVDDQKYLSVQQFLLVPSLMALQNKLMYLVNPAASQQLEMMCMQSYPRGASQKKIRDYLGVFPNRGWGGLLNPKTFVI